MAGRRNVKAVKSCRGKEEEPLPPIGGTREEIHRTLVETMEGILSGHIEPRRAYAIGRLCRVQLRLLEILERERKLKDRNAEKTNGNRSEKRRQDVGGTKSGSRWVN